MLSRRAARPTAKKVRTENPPRHGDLFRADGASGLTVREIFPDRVPGTSFWRF
jgi:hypothetical protein